MIKFLQMSLILLFQLSSVYSLELHKNPYQDLFVNGKILLKGGGPDCNSRYEAIKQVLDLYKRPITVLDIGAAEGYFSFRIAYEYDACCVMLGDPNSNDKFLEQLCIANTDLDKIILLLKRITPEELERLANCEHFDVVLALNVIHHFGNEWNNAFNAILKLGDNIIIETPPNGDAGAHGQPYLIPINNRLNQEQFIQLGQFRRPTDPIKLDRLVWLPKQKTTLKTNSFIPESIPSHYNYEVESTADNKFLKKFYNDQVFTKKEWIPGINLITFKCLNGTYPTKQTLVDSLNDIKKMSSTEWLPHNIIVGGKKCYFVSTDDPVQKKDAKWVFSEKLYQFMLDIMLANSKEEILDLYKNVLNLM